jgi:glycosyltransferase involved in cell wall biosynthesis
VTRIGLIYPAEDAVAPSNWSGTPAGLTAGFGSLGVEIVPVAYRLPIGAKQGVAMLSRLAGRRGTVAHRSPIQIRVRSAALARALSKAAPVDGVLAMGTEMYNLGHVVSAGVPAATYDDGTLAQIARYPESEVRRLGYPEEEIQRWTAQQAASLRSATACCVSTSWAARSVIADYGIASEHVHVVGMGHRPRQGDRVEKDWSAPKFLFVGLDWGRKNGEAVLKAFAMLREECPTATLDIVGAHPPIEMAGVIGHGALSRDDPEAQILLDGLFARATAFVLPSRFDPSPIAYLEAASAEIPVIATTEGGAGELLGEAAITVHPDDQEALLSGMRALADPVRAQSLGREAARRAATSEWSNVASRILDSLNLKA